MNELEFVCKKCGGTDLEEVMINCTVTSKLENLSEYNGEADFTYGDQENTDGEIDRYQCGSCGEFVAKTPEELLFVLRLRN